MSRSVRPFYDERRRIKAQLRSKGGSADWPLPEKRSELGPSFTVGFEDEDVSEERPMRTQRAGFAASLHNKSRSSSSGEEERVLVQS